jgi:hypothetical protein
MTHSGRPQERLAMMMQCFIVSSEEEIADIGKRMSAEGYRIAAISNAGLPPGKACLTYLPNSAFKKTSIPNDEQFIIARTR